jgi:hypothetical protein
MSKHQKSLLTRAVLFGLSANLPRLTVIDDGATKVIVFLGSLLAMSFMMYLFLAINAEKSTPVKVKKKNKIPNNVQTTEYGLDWRYKISLGVIFSVMFTVAFIFLVAIPLMELVVYSETTLLESYWNPYFTFGILLFVVILGVSWHSMVNARLALLPGGVRFSSWLITIHAGWDDVTGISMMTNPNKLVLKKVEVRGNWLMVKYWELIFQVDNSIPLSLFSWPWQKSGMQDNLEQYLRYSGE